MASTQPLPALYARALSTASRAANLPTIEDETQELLRSTLSDLKQVNSRVAALALFSVNDTLEDISTRDLVYLTVPFVLAEVENRSRFTDAGERMIYLSQVQNHLKTFVSNLEYLHVVSEEEHTLHTQLPSIKDAAKRREIKIQQHKAEQDLRARIATVRKRRRQRPIDSGSPNVFDLAVTLLPPTSRSSTANDDDNDETETEDILREASLLLLRLCYAQAYSQLESLEQELELLRSVPPPHPSPPENERREKAKDQEALWRLESTSRTNGGGPLLDPSSKPLRPFTILPSSASERARLQAQVFGPSHRLPTMTIDEYLEVERQRGNIITGGGRQSAERPTLSEQLTVDSEMEGTTFGEMKSEEKRQKDEQWAQFKDANPRGAGNIMNRG
ncbi:TAP42-like protein [Pisolithus tinctorius]|nr:TAP42-like protein [Pisolithus tinctorius]